MTSRIQTIKRKWKLRKCEVYYQAELDSSGTLIDIDYCVTHEQDHIKCKVEAMYNEL